MNVLCFYKKKKNCERTRLSEEITTLNVTVTQHRDLAPFLFCALFALRLFPCALFVLRPFCCALIVRALIVRALFAAPKCRGSHDMTLIVYHLYEYKFEAVGRVT